MIKKILFFICIIFISSLNFSCVSQSKACREASMRRGLMIEETNKLPRNKKIYEKRRAGKKTGLINKHKKNKYKKRR